MYCPFYTHLTPLWNPTPQPSPKKSSIAHHSFFPSLQSTHSPFSKDHRTNPSPLTSIHQPSQPCRK
ncbi:hypothetical protein DL95DRAFT_381612, partial [Leptodontidium sp. 2 PMI_412]